MKKVFPYLHKSFVVLAMLASLAVFTAAQKRDNLTEAEDLKVRESQEVDLRMKAYAKIISRRLAALSLAQTTTTKVLKKDDGKDWGELRQGSTQDLFWDIRKTLDEAISKIDDAAERDQKNPLFGKAVHIMAKGCGEWTPQFQAFLDKEMQAETKGLIQSSLEMCNQIIEASGKVSKEVPKEKKKKP